MNRMKRMRIGRTNGWRTATMVGAAMAALVVWSIGPELVRYLRIKSM